MNTCSTTKNGTSFTGGIFTSHTSHKLGRWK